MCGGWENCFIISQLLCLFIDRQIFMSRVKIKHKHREKENATYDRNWAECSYRSLSLETTSSALLTLASSALFDFNYDFDRTEKMRWHQPAGIARVYILIFVYDRKFSSFYKCLSSIYGATAEEKNKLFIHIYFISKIIHSWYSALGRERVRRKKSARQEGINEFTI